MTYTWVEPFAGAAAIALRLVGGRRLVPPVSWMGGKRKLALPIIGAMGMPYPQRPERVVLADAGPWGWVWPLLTDPERAAEVAQVLRSWEGEDPRGLWVRLSESPPFDEPTEAAAQWLWLQARSASGVPLWWDGWRYAADTGGGAACQKGDNSSAPSMRGRWSVMDHDTGRHHRAGQARSLPAGTWRMGEERSKARRGDRTVSQTGGGIPAWSKAKPGNRIGTADDEGLDRRWPGGGIAHPATIADRINAIANAFARVDVTIHHGDSGELLNLDLPGPLFVYLDPPYVGCTGYGWDCPRAEVIAMANAWSERGAVVAVSEAEAVRDDWHALDLTALGHGKPEWLTLNRPPARRPATQLGLFREDAA